MPSNNPYAKAADAYDTASAATDQRVLEGQLLLKATRKLEDLAKRLHNGETVSLEDIDDALIYNRKLWQVFLDTMMDANHLLPQEIKNNVASLAVFVFKRTQEILIDPRPEEFTALVNINRNIAAGLMKKPPRAQQPLAVKPAAETSITDSLA
jgi:flagellar protein FlaF